MGRRFFSYRHLGREASLEKGQPEGAVTSGTSFRQKAISRGNRSGHQPALTVSSISNAGFQIFSRQIRKVVEYFFFSHLGSEILKHFINRNSQASHTRFPTTFVWLNRDVISIVHSRKYQLQQVQEQATIFSARSHEPEWNIRYGSFIANDVCFIDWPHGAREP